MEPTNKLAALISMAVVFAFAVLIVIYVLGQA